VQGVRPGGGALHREAFLPQAVHDKLSRRGIVFDDQNAIRHKREPLTRTAISRAYRGAFKVARVGSVRQFCPAGSLGRKHV
jgi:hypothetical protein